MRVIWALVLAVLTGCQAAPPAPPPIVIERVVEVPVVASYSTRLDRACARFVRARVRWPDRAPTAAQAGDTFCGNVPAHAGRSVADDERWLAGLTRQIERRR